MRSPMRERLGRSDRCAELSLLLVRGQEGQDRRADQTQSLASPLSRLTRARPKAVCPIDPPLNLCQEYPPTPTHIGADNKETSYEEPPPIRPDPSTPDREPYSRSRCDRRVRPRLGPNLADYVAATGTRWRRPLSGRLSGPRRLDANRPRSQCHSSPPAPAQPTAGMMNQSPTSFTYRRSIQRADKPSFTP
jgi:hypothetical protein